VKGQVKAANKGKPEAEGAKKDIGPDNTPKGFRDALVKVTKAKDRWDEALAAKAKLGDNSVDTQVTAAEKAYKDSKKSYDDAVKVHVQAANEGKIAAEDAKKDIDTDLGFTTPEGVTAALGKVNKAKAGRDQAKAALGDNSVDAQVTAAEKAYKDTKKSYDDAVKVHVEAANKGKKDAKKAQANIGTDLSKNTPEGFTAALDKLNEAKAGWDQAKEAKAVLGANKVDAEVTVAEKAYHATKKLYDEAIAAKEEEVKAAKGVAQAKAEEVHRHLEAGHMLKAMWAAKAAWKALEAADALPKDWASRTENVKIAKEAVEISNRAVQEYNATLKVKKDPGKDIYIIKTT
jgi:hypothetical protein